MNLNFFCWFKLNPAEIGNVLNFFQEHRVFDQQNIQLPETDTMSFCVQ